MSKSGYLTAEEYRAIRILLGMTLKEAKEFHRVQNVSTIKRWESGYSRVSELACDKITRLLEQINWVIDQAIQLYEANLDRGDLKVTLITYPDDCLTKFVSDWGDLPPSVHHSMIFRTYINLKARGAKVGVVKFNPQDYFAYMASHNLKDCQSTRAAWAGDYHDRLLKQEN